MISPVGESLCACPTPRSTSSSPKASSSSLRCAPAASPTPRASVPRSPLSAELAHRARRDVRVVRQQREQLTRPPHVVRLHHAVVEHHPDRPALPHVTGEALVELLL